MKICLIIIILIVIIVILSFILWKFFPRHKYTEKSQDLETDRNSIPTITGGEGIGLSFGNETENNKKNVTFSDLAIEKYRTNNRLTNTGFDMSEIPSILDSSIECYRNFGTMNYEGRDYYICQNIEPKFVSDSLLDGLLMIQHPEIKNIFGKNEFKTFRLRTNEFRDGFFKDEKHNQPFQLQNIDSEVRLIKNFNYEKRSKIDINVFIEFTYPNGLKKVRVLNLYREIHEKTKEILTQIIELSKIYNKYKLMFIIRIDIENLDYLRFMTEFYPEDKLVIIHNDWRMSRYMTLNIPNSATFGMDEFLIIETSNDNFYIQIEHSEDLGRHKSNLIEFVLRNCKDYEIDIDRTFEIIRYVCGIKTNEYFYFQYLQKIRNTNIEISELTPKRRKIIEMFKTLTNYDENKLFIRLINCQKINPNSVFKTAYPEFFDRYINQNCKLLKLIYSLWF